MGTFMQPAASDATQPQGGHAATQGCITAAASEGVLPQEAVQVVRRQEEVHLSDAVSFLSPLETHNSYVPCSLRLAAAAC
jgi:hypothetical protein